MIDFYNRGWLVDLWSNKSNWLFGTNSHLLQFKDCFSSCLTVFLALDCASLILMLSVLLIVCFFTWTRKFVSDSAAKSQFLHLRSDFKERTYFFSLSICLFNSSFSLSNIWIFWSWALFDFTFFAINWSRVAYSSQNLFSRTLFFQVPFLWFEWCSWA